MEFVRSIGAKTKVLPLGILISLIKKYPFLGRLYPYVSLIYSFFIKVDEDILLVDGGSCIYTAAHLKKRVRNIKLIYLDNDTIFYNVHKKTTEKENLKFFLDSIDGIISDSEQNKRYSMELVNVPIEVCRPYPSPVKKQRIQRENYGLYVGRLDPDKNIERMVQFWLQCPFVEKLVILGSGTQEDYVKKMAKLHKKIIFLGKRDDVEKYYSQCKFLVHINDYDPHPRTTMEAAMCGCFPIISKGIGTRYLFDDIFVVNNPNDFAEINLHMQYIVKNEGMARELLRQSTEKMPTQESACKAFHKAFFSIIHTIT